MTLEHAAYGAHLIAASNMIRAIKAVSTERGRDPREFALFAFGGNGPLFAAGMAAALGITPDRGAAVGRACSPRSGCSTPTSSTTMRARSAGCCGRPISARSTRPGTRWRDQASDAARRGGLHRRPRPAAALGGAALQGPELRADRAGAGRPDRCATWSRIWRRPSARSTSGPTATAPAPTSRSSWWRSRSSARACARAAACPTRVTSSRAGAGRAGRRAAPISATSTAGSTRRSCAAPTSASRRAGPLIVEEYDATCVVPPGAHAELDAAGNIVIEL